MTPTRTASLAWVEPLARFAAVRRNTEQLFDGLEPEDMQLQPTPETSPVKWHLAHTTWFYEQNLLGPYLSGYRPFHPAYGYLFNSNERLSGRRNARAERGMLSRPTLRQVVAYRKHVDDAVGRLLTEQGETAPDQLRAALNLALNHEQQHQELILTDLKYAFSRNPLMPAIVLPPEEPDRNPVPQTWHDHPGGLVEVGPAGGEFACDGEGPRHQVFLQPYVLAGRLVSNSEYMQFVEASGYDQPELWLADGWAARKRHRWEAPLYWERIGATWSQYTLGGVRPLADAEPVTHISYYEADAFARWAGARLATEQEWEVATLHYSSTSGHFADDRRYHPAPAAETGLTQLFGDCWEWTASPYIAYPNYKPQARATGEHNGKFMCNRMVLRGGSCVSPRGHVRRTSRNFYPPETRWQFSGIRLCRDA